MQLTPHFSLAELTTTETGLDNTPPDDLLPTLQLLAEFMEKVRTALGNFPITVDSAYRSPAVNAAVGGVSNSAHALGYACDFTCAEYGDPYHIALTLSAAMDQGHIAFDQLIQEGTWVHV